jgi:hypothetical protein
MRRSLPMRATCVLFALAVATIAFPIQPTPKVVRPFLVYYGGFPAHGGPVLARRLAARFRGYPVVVFGWALRRPALAARVRAALPQTRFYGYVDTGHVRMAQVLEDLAALRRLRFAGALLDDVGSGLSAHQAALQAIVDAAYRDHLHVLLNSFDPAPVAALRLRPAQTAVLCEDWVFSDGAWHAPRPEAAYATLFRLEARGVAVFMIVTAARAPVQAAAVAAGVRATVYREYGAYLSVSGPNYSAQSNAIFPVGRLRAMLAAISF